MGGLISSPETKPSVEVPDDVNALYERGACNQCIARILSISRIEMEKFNLPNIHKNNCFVCHGVISHLDDVRNKIRAAIGRYSFHDIQIEVVPNLIKNDNKLMKQYKCQTSCNLKNYLKGQIQLSFRRINDGPTLYIKINSSTDIKTNLRWPPLYIIGRYYKRSRRVSNTRFMRGQRAISSVEKELLNAIAPEIRCTERKFVSAGREDMDVRMIGSGRPFCITLLNPSPNDNDPRIPKSDEEFAATFNGFLPEENEIIECENDVSASDLRITCLQPDISPRHEKCYRCIVSCSRNISEENLANLDRVKDLIIHQKTPARVAHRRILATREKTVISMSYKQICPRFFILDLKTSKGTYIKEFVNSDFGRTKPSLGDLLDPERPVECQLLQLDVVFVSE